jgi:hypothetical protein
MIRDLKLQEFQRLVEMGSMELPNQEGENVTI